MGREFKSLKYELNMNHACVPYDFNTKIWGSVCPRPFFRALNDMGFALKVLDFKPP